MHLPDFSQQPSSNSSDIFIEFSDSKDPWFHIEVKFCCKCENRRRLTPECFPSQQQVYERLLALGQLQYTCRNVSPFLKPVESRKYYLPAIRIAEICVAASSISYK